VFPVCTISEAVVLLGINAAYHESAACLVNGTTVVAAAEEERFTGIRHAKEPTAAGVWSMPHWAVASCLSRMTGSQTVDHIACSFDPWLRLRRMAVNPRLHRLRKGIRELGLFTASLRPLELLCSTAPKNQLVRSKLTMLAAGKPKLHRIRHHLAHAASCFYPSPFREAAILTVDGIGEWCCTFLAVGQDTELKAIREVPFPHSLGFFYEEVTRFLGFERNRDEFKITALSCYGKPRYADALRRLVAQREDGRYTVQINFRQESALAVRELVELLGPPRLPGSELSDRHADIAASAQVVLEETVLHILHFLRRRTGQRALCLAGGVFLNCRLNERIRQESGFEQIFIQPAANDAGTALGAALWVAHNSLGRSRMAPIYNWCLGPSFDENAIGAALKERGLLFRQSADIARDCASLLAKGNILGWFQGNMEWGPRALGHRSILADPRYVEMRDRINRIKGRESFRPVAPSVREEDMQSYFSSPESSPHMLFARQVRPEAKQTIPAAVHVDGSARVQTVSALQHPLFHRLLSEFRERTGVGVLLNSSLNSKGKPIACTVDQAVECFFNTPLDFLAIGPFLVGKVSLAPNAA